MSWLIDTIRPHADPMDPIAGISTPLLRLKEWAAVFSLPCLPPPVPSHETLFFSQEIQSLLTNWKGPDLTSYGELVLEGTFRLQRAKNERTLFLFDKLLLITKKRDDTFTYKAHILVGVHGGPGQGLQQPVAFSPSELTPSLLCAQCGNLMLVEVIPKEPLSFSVFHYKNPKLQHTVQVKAGPASLEGPLSATMSTLRQAAFLELSGRCVFSIPSEG